MNGLVEKMRDCSIQDKNKRVHPTDSCVMDDFFADPNVFDEQDALAEEIQKFEKKRNKDNDWTILNLPPVKIVTKVSDLP
jgi:hypothetical protein